MASPNVRTKDIANITSLQSSPMFWTMLAIIGLGTIFLFEENLSGTIQNGLPSLLALAAWLGFGLIGILIVLALQRYGHRPIWTVVLAVAWGALAAGGLAQYTNIALETIFTRQWNIDPSAWATAPFVEEILKGLGVMTLALIPAVRIRSSLDGLFYGIIVGAGFMVCENFLYTVGELINNPGNVGETLYGMILVRGIMGGAFTHPVFSGLIGAAIGHTVTRTDSSLTRRVTILVTTVIVSLLIHSIWNRQDVFNGITLIVGIIAFVLLVAAIILTRREEEKRLVRLAPDFVKVGLMNTDDINALKATKDRKSRAPYRKAVLRYTRAVDMLGSHNRATAKAAKRLLAARQ